jgi:hypothetical protein
MAGGARSGGLEPAQMLIAAAQLSIFDLKYGKFLGRRAPQCRTRVTEFSAVRVYTPTMKAGPRRCR